MRPLFIIIPGMMLWAWPSWAQEQTVTTDTSALQDVLSNLKDSVEKLSLDNNQLSVRDKYVQQQVLQLQLQLGQVEAQGDLLDKSAEKLKYKNPRRDQQIDRLEKENADLDDHIKNAEGGIKLAQKSLDAGYQEDQRLLIQLKQMTKVSAPSPAVPTPESRAAEHRQKEKLKLMKMIYDSQQRQEKLHLSILAIQTGTPILPAAGALARQQLLKIQIKDLEAQIAAYSSMPSVNPGIADQWDADQLRQLELELKVLEKNYSQLKDLMEKMTIKAQSFKMTVSQRIEEKKLQDSIDDLKRQGEGLKANLDDLRSQMVDLDKRKSRLETMVQQTR